jgi:hypothetical protein
MVTGLIHMSDNVLEFMREWGGLATAIPCLAAGFCHAWVCSVGTRDQKTGTFVLTVLTMFACMMIDVYCGNSIPPKERMMAGQFIERMLLGIPVPVLAGIGLFAWCNPRKWVGVAEMREQLRERRNY